VGEAPSHWCLKNMRKSRPAPAKHHHNSTRIQYIRRQVLDGRMGEGDGRQQGRQTGERTLL